MSVASTGNFGIEIPMFGDCMAKSSCASFSTIMKSKTETNCTLCEGFFLYFEEVTDNCCEFLLVHHAVCSCCC